MAALGQYKVSDDVFALLMSLMEVRHGMAPVVKRALVHGLACFAAFAVDHVMNIRKLFPSEQRGEKCAVKDMLTICHFEAYSVSAVMSALDTLQLYPARM